MGVHRALLLLPWVGDLRDLRFAPASWGGRLAHGKPAAPAPNAFGKNLAGERCDLALPAIDADGKHDDEAEHDLLPGGRHIVQVQPILDNYDRERPQQG